MAITSWVRILASVGMIILGGAVAAGATGAFFSDTETSTGNTFTAGAIDLQIDNESYFTNSLGELEASTNNSWTLSDITNQLFFSFTDLKPGDIGEDTISVHAGTNDAWACLAVDVTSTPENTLVGPETDANDTGEPGELQNYLNFTFWRDDGDNVFEDDEVTIPSLSNVAASSLQGAWHAIADFANGPVISGNQTRYVGKAWCFGTLSTATTPVAQDDLGKTNPNTNGPLERGTGFNCSGSGSQNDAQTDGIEADVSFYAEQARNNGSFLCSNLNT